MPEHNDSPSRKPQTEAGRMLLGTLDGRTTLHDIRMAILAIEAEAGAIDVDRLARALTVHRGDSHTDGEDYETAEAIAAAYAAEEEY